MRRALVGFIAGIFVGAAATSFAAKMVGGNGYLIGWTVDVGDEEVCSDPYIWHSTKQIECD